VLTLAQGIHCADDKASLKVAERDLRFKSRADLRNPLIKDVFVRTFFKDLVDFYDREYVDGVRPHLAVALLNQSIGFVGVSASIPLL
jgi:hypothetical protein